MVGRALDRIYAAKDIATKTEKKVIDGILNIPSSEIIYLSISDLESRLNVAEATLVRFCKKLGYNGFQEFKLHLSQDTAMLSQNDSDSATKKIALQMVDAINETVTSAGTLPKISLTTCSSSSQTLTVNNPSTKLSALHVHSSDESMFILFG